MVRPAWPALPLSEWEETRDTLQLWLQIVGKVRMVSTPLINHWWNVALYVTSNGLTTSLMQHPAGAGFQINLDLQDHRLVVGTAEGRQASAELRAMPVSEFYGTVMALLDELGLHTEIWPMPVEIPGAIRFDTDDAHCAYDPEYAYRFWEALASMLPVFTEFRSRFLGKASPVHLWWGALDLATSRFSGRPAPPHPGGAPNCGPHVMLEAYSHEVSSSGFWPGGDGEGLFYSYIYPSPPEFEAAGVRPAEAHWSQELGEFVLPYDVVRRAQDPRGTLLDFLQTTYAAAADAARWDRAALERSSSVSSDLSAS